jgi:hypothetical protein
MFIETNNISEKRSTYFVPNTDLASYTVFDIIKHNGATVL